MTNQQVARIAEVRAVRKVASKAAALKKAARTKKPDGRVVLSTSGLTFDVR
jgi:hypothetical protein